MAQGMAKRIHGASLIATPLALSLLAAAALPQAGFAQTANAKSANAKSATAKAATAQTAAAQAAKTPAAKTPAAKTPAASPREKILVSADWVKAHAADKNLVLLQVGDQTTYDAGHIVGARFLAMDGLSVSGVGDGALTLEVPAADDLRKQLETLGLTDASRIVVYLGAGMVPAATRIVFTLDAAGFGDRVVLLDGGLNEWRRAAYPTTTDVPEPKAGHLSPLKLTSRVVDARFVQDHLRAPDYKVVDARAAMFYDGLAAGGTPAEKQPKGHISGAISVPFTSITRSDQTLKSADELAAAFKAAGVASGDHLIVYCHVGWQGAAVVFAARSLGVDAVLYDGSFQDWSHRGLPVEGPGAPKWPDAPK